MITSSSGTGTALLARNQLSQRDQTSGSIGATSALARQAESDEQLLVLWLHGRSEHTRRAYGQDAERLLDFVGKPLRAVTLGDLQKFATMLADPDRELAPA